MYLYFYIEKKNHNLKWTRADSIQSLVGFLLPES